MKKNKRYRVKLALLLAMMVLTVSVKIWGYEEREENYNTEWQSEQYWESYQWETWQWNTSEEKEQMENSEQESSGDVQESEEQMEWNQEEDAEVSTDENMYSERTCGEKNHEETQMPVQNTPIIQENIYEVIPEQQSMPVPTNTPVPSRIPEPTVVPMASSTPKPEKKQKQKKKQKKKKSSIRFQGNSDLNSCFSIQIFSEGSIQVLSLQINSRECPWHWEGDRIVPETNYGKKSKNRIKLLIIDQSGNLIRMEPDTFFS